MILSKIKEDYLRNFFARQREIGKRALAASASLAQANMEMILLSGISTPNQIVASELRDEVDIQKELEDVKAERDTLKEELKIAQGQIKDVSGQA